MLSLFRTYFSPLAPLFLGALVLTIARVVCELEVPNYMSDIVDTGIVGGDVDYIVSTGAKMLAWAAGAMIADVLADLCSSRASMGFGRNIRSAVYARVSDFSLAETDSFGTSSLITRTTNDVQQLERFSQMTMTIAMMSPIMLVGASIASLSMSIELSAVIFCAIPILIVLALIVMKFAMPLLRSLQRKIDALNRVTREGLSGMRVIRAYRREDHEEARFSEANRDLAETNVKVARRVSALMPAITLVLNLAIIAIVWVGAQLVELGNFQVGDMMAIIQYATHVLMSTMMLSSVFMIWPRASAAAERIGAVLDTEPSITDSAGADEQNVISGTSGGEPATRGGAASGRELATGEEPQPLSVRFDSVTYRFPGAPVPAVRDVTLELEAGRTYALVGATGSGKTTLVNLLLRFIEPDSGTVEVGGTDVSAIPQTDLHRAIAYVPQTTVLFSGTIADNIRYGNEGATDGEVEAAARAARAHAFITATEDGYGTRITQASTGLSGGQRQRVAIARALVKRSGLFVFDDSFSALDFATDAAIRADLPAATHGATVLVVAQRVAWAMAADEVIVMDAGRIEAVGTHAELLESSATYRDIVASQLDSVEVP